MRVADQQMYGILLGNLQRSRLQMLTSQEQISSQKRVTNPADDPSAFGQIVLDKSALSQTTQWVRNINFGTSRVNAADQALGQVQNLITRVRELTIQASSDTTSAEGRQSIAKEVRQLQRQLVQLGNTEVAGQAIFGGTKTDVQPFTITSGDTVAYQGNSETQSIAVGENQTVQILVPGSSIFTGSTTNMFDSLRDLLTALESNNRSGIQAGLGNLDLATAQISDVQGTVGALANRLQVTHDALDTATLTITKSISDNQDADLATAITQLRLQEVAVQAASETFTKIFDSSLINYLR
ncbi:MAG: flagellar hook-associated protein FlgL [Nitrospira sp.]|jgi:flagellar hook-associated protein 3 FlgL|uniref:flagellar hook-associated protein FlgL n=1 Tax=Nitrospira sp. ND1 TaxID=1658518 RepID=UPI0009BC1524|nr:flagellar hook-associated protein FlgL [Nitrospira sp. ND1]MBK7487559.1 flagellar hook-associated protein FlgL [Nitrospira sp.]MBP9636692.1 flagellar hook-associated protein FlgL [Nitrospira sp.]SLM41948.1 putative Second flagellar hook-filament junction protein FlgL [Nitrospira sp. ND1]HNV31587.1 flagellar hook-associated protein FlgL [Nitrospira sp.]HPW14198.1 flagellar hook-associated protein FlgL [Nitrospira sp.]